MITKYAKINKPDKTIEYGLLLLPYIDQGNILTENTKVAKLYQTIGQSYTLTGKYNEAIEFSLKSKEIYSELKDDFNIALSLRTIGSAYQSLGNFEKSLENLFVASEIFENKKDLLNKPEYQREKRVFCSVFETIGIIYGKLTQVEKAEQYFNKAINIYKGVQYKKVISTMF